MSLVRLPPKTWWFESLVQKTLTFLTVWKSDVFISSHLTARHLNCSLTGKTWEWRRQMMIGQTDSTDKILRRVLLGEHLDGWVLIKSGDWVVYELQAAQTKNFKHVNNVSGVTWALQAQTQRQAPHWQALQQQRGETLTTTLNLYQFRTLTSDLLGSTWISPTGINEVHISCCYWLRATCDTCCMFVTKQQSKSLYIKVHDTWRSGHFRMLR